MSGHRRFQKPAIQNHCIGLISDSDFQNRGLSTAQVIDLLYHETPRFWELCQVVGKWVWIQFQEKQPRNVTAQLSQLGFHWNRRRQVWQHPCGQFRTGTWIDPRDKYPTFYPAD